MPPLEEPFASPTFWSTLPQYRDMSDEGEGEMVINTGGKLHWMLSTRSPSRPRRLFNECPVGWMIRQSTLTWSCFANSTPTVTSWIPSVCRPLQLALGSQNGKFNNINSSLSPVTSSIIGRFTWWTFQTRQLRSWIQWAVVEWVRRQQDIEEDSRMNNKFEVLNYK